MADETEQTSCATTIIIVRHGDVHNPKDIVYGRLPRFRLSDIGREEATRTAEVLKDVPVAALYSSPQLRARQTAGFIATQHPDLKINVTPLLDEVFTSYQGTANKIMQEKKYNYYDQPAGENDETVEQVVWRMRSWFQLMLKRHPCQVVVGVSHGDPTMIARIVFNGLEPSSQTLRTESLYPHKASISRFVFHDSGADPWQQKPEVFYDDPNRSAREEREAVQRAARGETGPPLQDAPSTENAPQS